MTTTTDTSTFRRTVTASVPIVLRALDPIHHGAGTAGNTSLIRMQDFYNEETQEFTRTPIVSGNSIRHGIREALAWLAVDTLKIEDRSLSKAMVDLLWSGGALTATGAQTDLHALSERHRLLPFLPLMGYSYLSDIVRGSLRVSIAHLACAENRWRLPAAVMRDPAAGRRAVEWIGEEFGTRHDVAGGPVDRLLEEAVFGTPSTQMIYDMQVVVAGSLWTFSVEVDAAVPASVDALAAALTRVSRGGVWYLGAKRSVGFGRCKVVAADTSQLTDDPPAAAARFVDNLTGCIDDARALLQGGAA